MALWLDNLFLGTVDALFALRPVAPVTPAAAARLRVISHRGERDNRSVFENTYAAFDPLRGSGVFGLECDVRWTRDLVPVVFHDPSLLRLFGERERLADLTWDDLRRRRPEIPDLYGYVRRYAAEFHLMVEIKLEPYPDPPLQDRRLAEALAPALETGRCHVLSLAPQLFEALPSLPPQRTMSIGRLAADAMSAEALAGRRGGFSCHYASLRARHIAAHHAAGQEVGCGFPASRAVLHREIARGVDYAFTNLARRLEAWRRAAAQAPPAPAPGTPAPPR